MFVARTAKTARTERTEREVPEFRSPTLAVLAVLSVLSACARIEPPPGGPPDRSPPRLLVTRPDSFATLQNFDGEAEFEFDEVVSEGGSPNTGQGTGGLEKLVIVSPTTQVPEVNWRRSRITVKPREGWRPNRVYRVQLLPGVTDLRNNPSREGAVLTFSTGAPRPQNTLQGLVVDWSTNRPAPAALIVASLLPDSLPYRGLADSSGRFSLGPLPAGDYLVSGVLDQNQNLVQDAREAYGSARVQQGRSDVGELWAFVHDTVPPRIQNATADDSVSATITFSQKLDPRQRLTTGDVRLRLLPDSVPVAVASILPKPVDDSLNRRTPAVDTTAADTTRRRDSLPARRRTQRAAPDQSESRMLTSRPPLFDRLVVRVPRPWAPGARLVIEVRGVRNVTGVAGTAVGVIAVPERPKPTAGDTARAAGRRDTTRAAGRRDTTRAPGGRDTTRARPPARTPGTPQRP